MAVTAQQIQMARKAGYSDDEIVSHLADTEPQMKTAIKAGYSPAEIMAHFDSPKQTVTGNLNASPAETERMRREFVQREGTLATRAKDVVGQAFNPNNRIPAADSVSDFATRVLPQSLTQLGPKMIKGTYDVVKGQTDPVVNSLSSLRPTGQLPGPQMERNAGRTITGLAEAMTAPTGLIGADRAKEAWLTDPAGSVLAISPLVKPSLRTLGKVADTVPRPRGTTLEGVIDTGIDKGIRPGIEGNRTFAQSSQYHKRAQQAVKTIIDNHAQGALKLTDEFGEVTPTLPKNLRQFSQAIDQSKRNIYEQYNKMAVESGEAGAVVDLSPIPNELMSVANNRALQKAAPGVAEYAKSRAQAFSGDSTKTDGITSRRSNTFTTEEAQQAIAIYNQSLEAFNKNPSYDTASRAYIDSLIVNHLRKGLDASIEKATGPGYQALKNEYGALKTIEKDVSRRAIVDARKNPKGLLDFSDVFSGGQVINGLLSMNPAVVGSGIASKVIANIYKLKNDPNKIVSKMFDKAGKMYTPKQAAEINVTRPLAPQAPTENSRYGTVNNAGISQPGPQINSIGPVNTGVPVLPQEQPNVMRGVNSGNLSAPARNQVDPYLSGAKSKQPAAPVKPSNAMTWKDFLSANMGAYMKSEGGHGPAIRKLAEEWKKRNK